MKAIGEQFEIKNGEYGPPMTYLGAGISQVQLDDSSMCWSMESQKYVKATIDTIRALLIEDSRELKGGHSNWHHGPLPPSYRLSPWIGWNANMWQRYGIPLQADHWNIPMGHQAGPIRHPNQNVVIITVPS